VLATASFGGEFTCMVNKGHIYGAQFHPEKSLKFGMDVLKNFSSL
jgi:glutamine amidotransferase